MTWHELVAGAVEPSAQLVELNVPPAPPSLQVTFAEGYRGEAAVSLTAAVRRTVPPTATLVELAVTVVCVGCWETVREAVPELVARMSSPEYAALTVTLLVLEGV